MIKFLNNDDKQLIFNYLNIDFSALLSAVTEIYPNSYVTGGVFAVQSNGEKPVSLIANGESFSLLFTTDKSDFAELSFTLQGEIHSPSPLPFTKTGEYYLLKRETDPCNPKQIGKYEDFKTVLDFNNATETVNLQYLFKKGLLIPYAVENIGGGFIINSEKYSVISHIFVKQEMRGKGYGTEIVKNLLKCCLSKNIYLISEKSNLEFYAKLGFTPVLTVHKYKSKAEKNNVGIF